MHRTVLAAATLAILVGGSLAPPRAEAMPVAPSDLTAAVPAGSLTQGVAYVCHRVWRCGPYGCGWRRACYYTRPYRYDRRHYYYRRW